MGFWNDLGRGALAAGTLGLSEAVPGSAWLGGAGREIDPANARWTDGDYLRQQYERGADQAGRRVAPQAGQTQLGRISLGQAAQLDPTQQAQFRAQQMQQAQRLGQIASGQMQGAGELAAQRQAARSAASQQAMARMGRGLSGASLARGAARNVADIGANAAGQAQIAAMQDQQGANQMLGSLLAQGRDADIGMAGQNAQLSQQQMLQQGTFDQQRAMQQGQMNQQQQLANLDAQLRQQGMNDAARQAYLQMYAQMNQSEMAGRLGQEQAAMQQPGLLGPLLQAGGTIGAAAASDERVKTDIKHGGDEVDSMLDALKPTTYAYKKDSSLKEYTGGVGDGRRLAGIMAQALEQSKAGKAIVHDTPGGKVLDGVGALSAALASVARLNERLRKVEGKAG
jgi:hypothetical protein